jgi:LacI family transcriptional regulator
MDNQRVWVYPVRDLGGFPVMGDRARWDGDMQHKITIEDISRHTGLSRGTVSRALNDRPDISEQTKRRVLEACTQLKYVPSHAARSLATGRRYAVAILVDDLRSTFASSFLRGAIKRARQNHYAVHVSELGEDHAGALEHLRSLVSERVDSVLIGTWLSPELVRQVGEATAERSVVSTSPLELPAADLLAPDYVEAGRLAARCLIAAAHNEILYVLGTDSAPTEQCRRGFYEVCLASGIDPDAITVTLGPRAPEYHGRLDALAERLGRVRGAAGSDDFVALELMLLAARIGRKPGRDLALIGHGNDPFGAYTTPTLTTIDLSGEEIGDRAMDLALQRVTKVRQDAPPQTLVAPILIQRESTPAC